jgi:opacity protein-like surface antigen
MSVGAGFKAVMLLRYAFLSGAVLCSLAAQVDFGVTAGAPLTPFILDTSAGSRAGSARVTSAVRRYTLGPYVAFPLRDSLDIETGALYKRFGFDTHATSFALPSGVLTSVDATTTGHSWEFPILARVRLRFLSGVNGFLAAGPSVRRLTGITERGRRTVRSSFPPPAFEDSDDYETGSPSGMNRRTSFGVALGGGFEFQTGSLRLAPGVRLTRWDTERTSSLAAPSRLARTQLDVLLVVGYARTPHAESRAAVLPCCWEPGVIVAVAATPLAEAGAPNTPFPARLDAPFRRLAGGALLDWRFRPRLSLEGSFLVRRFGHVETISFPNLSSVESVSGYAWEVPLQMKFRIVRMPGASAWAGAGPAVRRASSVLWRIDAAQPITVPGSSISRSSFGAAVSGGVEFKAGKARLRPELRYTWFGRLLYDLTSVRTRRDSVVILLGVSPVSASR